MYAPDQPGWQRLKEALLTLKTVCNSSGIALQVVLLPELHRLQNYPFQKEHEQVKSFLNDHRISHLDLAPFFAGETNPMRLWVARDDAHPNAAAHERIARFSFNFLADSLPNKANAS